MKKRILPFPRQNKLAGKLRQYQITYEELANGIGMSAAGVEAIMNGRVDFKLSIARKICLYISKKSGENVELSDIVE